MRNRCSQLDTVPHPPPLTISGASTTNCLHTHTHTCVHTQTRCERLAVLHWVYLHASWGLFTVHFPLGPDCVSRFWVNTWYNLVLLPLLSFYTSVFSHSIFITFSWKVLGTAICSSFFGDEFWWFCRFMSKKIVNLHSKFSLCCASILKSPQ